MKVYVVRAKQSYEGMIGLTDVLFVTSKEDLVKEYCYENNRISMYNSNDFEYYYTALDVEDDITVQHHTNYHNVNICARSPFDIRYNPTNKDCHDIKQYGKDEYRYYDCVIPMIPNEDREHFHARLNPIMDKMRKEFYK